MKAAKIVVPFLIFGLTLPAPIGSSDFSQLGEPAFARSLMISPERHVELQCAALAYLPYRKLDVIDVANEPEYGDEPTDEMIAEAEAQLSQYPYSEKMVAPNFFDEPPSKYELNIAPPAAVEELGDGPEKQFAYEKILTEAEAESLKSAVVSRLVSDIGDDKMAQQSLDQRFTEFEVPFWDESEENIAARKLRRETMANACASLFDAARANTLDANLSPASAEPIALMTVDTCLAYDLIARKSSDYDVSGILSDRDAYAALVGPKGSARKARMQKISAVAASLGKVDPRVAAAKSIPCLATYVTELKKNPEFWEATE